MDIFREQPESGSGQGGKIDHYKVSRVIQSDDYYPFGLTLSGTSYQRIGEKENRYLYNGKELQTDLDLNWYDYGARMYMPELGRWGVVDPMIDRYSNLSGYIYANNNPTFFIDLYGMVSVTAYATTDPNEIKNILSHLKSGKKLDDYVTENGKWNVIKGDPDNYQTDLSTGAKFFTADNENGAYYNMMRTSFSQKIETASWLVTSGVIVLPTEGKLYNNWSDEEIDNKSIERLISEGYGSNINKNSNEQYIFRNDKQGSWLFTIPTNNMAQALFKNKWYNIIGALHIHPYGNAEGYISAEDNVSSPNGFGDIPFFMISPDQFQVNYRNINTAFDEGSDAYLFHSILNSIQNIKKQIDQLH